ncbi:MAG: hypothetical protein ACP5PB_02405 [Acidimicrobiales bacterium]
MSRWAWGWVLRIVLGRAVAQRSRRWLVLGAVVAVMAVVDRVAARAGRPSRARRT